MNEKLNLVEILKDAPKSTKLWSPICGECELRDVNTSSTDVYPIKCISKNHQGILTYIMFTANGEYSNYFANGECVLFPSKENKDWSTFKISKNHKVFKPFEKVLVKEIVGRNFDKLVWLATEYSHYDEDLKQHYCTQTYGFDDDAIIPYNGNEDKLGRTVK